MRKNVLYLCCILSILLSGCHSLPVTNNVLSRIVTEITVTCDSCSGFTRRYYNTHEKMEKILLYIRWLGPGFTPDTDPESAGGKTICITMTGADGSQKVYRQKDNRFFQEGSQPWQRVDPRRAAGLWQIILDTPSDPEEQPSAAFGPASLPGFRPAFPAGGAAFEGEKIR